MHYRVWACSEKKSLAQFFRKDKNDSMDDHQFRQLLNRLGFSCSGYRKGGQKTDKKTHERPGVPKHLSLSNGTGRER